MESQVKVALILSAVDRMSRIVNESVNKSIRGLKNFKEQADRIADKGISLENFGSAIIGNQVLRKPIEAFAELEDGQARLQSVMMTNKGLAKDTFSGINKQAIELGNALPGTTNDFYNMFSTMLQGGAKAENIINGTGKAAAYLAVQIRLPYEEVGRGVAKLQVATGVADKDMMDFMDTIQRTVNLGVDFNEMQMAFSRSAGQLKFLKLQGLQATNQIAALYAMFIRQGATGETVGTGISSALQAIFDQKKMAEANAEAARLGVNLKFLDKRGNFLGVDNFISQFNKLKGFSQSQISGVLTPLFGPTGQDIQFIKTISSGGLSAFRGLQTGMKSQASLTERVNHELQTLKNVWDALTGTFKNFLAGIGGSIAPGLKKLATCLNDLTAKTANFMETHKRLSKIIGWSIGIVGGLALAAGSLGIALGVVARIASFTSSGFLFFAKGIKAIQYGLWVMKYHLVTTTLWTKIAAATQWLFNASLYGCPVVWIVVGIMAVIGAVILLVKYWDYVVAFFKTVWYGIKTVFLAIFNVIKVLFLNLTPLGFIVKNWNVISPYFRKLWDGVKFIFQKMWDWIKFLFLNFTPLGQVIKHWNVIGPFFKKLWDGVKGIFMGFVKFIFSLGSKFFEAGKNIVHMIWKGIEGLAYKPVETIHKMVKKLRNLLPFSPAKEGPLRDIHKIKLIETIAQSIKPQPLLKVMEATMGNVSMRLRGSLPAFQGSPAGGLVISPVFNVTIHGGAGPGTKNDIIAAIKDRVPELIRIIDDANRRRERINLI